MKAAGNNRHGHRYATMILIAFRHGLRASELCSLRWEQVDLVHGRLHVNRLKNGIPSVHPLTGIELCALRRLPCEQKPGRFVFMSEGGTPMSGGLGTVIGRSSNFFRLQSQYPSRSLFAHGFQSCPPGG